MSPVTRWGVKWRSLNRLDGRREHLCFDPRDTTAPVMFKTRREARNWIERTYGYIRSRPDLQNEPHGWQMPVPVRVQITESNT